MHAIELYTTGAPEVMTYKQVEPPTPAAYEVLIEVKAIGVNPVDTYIRAGDYALQQPLPYTPGWECAGEVVALGVGVEDFKVGDRVYTTRTISGAYAEQCTAHVDFVHPLPDRIDWLEGAAVGIAYGTAYRALFDRGEGQPNDWVLIHGASGGVGLAAVQLAAARGLRCIGTASSAEGQQLVLSSGAIAVVNHRNDKHLQQAIKKALAIDPTMEGFNVIVEMAAHINLQADLHVIARHGKLVVVGSRGSLMFDPRSTMGKEIDVRGAMIYGASAQARRRMHAAIFAGLRDGTLSPRVGKTYPLREAAQSHIDITSDAAKMGKLILIP